MVQFIRLVETEYKFSCFSWLVYGSGDYFNICSFDKSVHEVPERRSARVGDHDLESTNGLCDFD